MKILVAGGTGFLGTHLVPKLLQRGHDTLVLTRNPEAIARIEQTGATGLTGDLLSEEVLSLNIPGLDAIIMVAQPQMFGKRIGAGRFRRLSEEVRRMHSHALALAAAHNCPVLLTAGTAYATTGDEIADETWPMQRSGIARIGDSVDALLEDALQSGAPVFVRMMPGQIYGPGGMFFKMLQWALNGRNRIMGDGSNYIPRIHVDDCADAYVLAVENLASCHSGDHFIVADDVPCTTGEFTREYSSQLRLPPPKPLPFIARGILRLVLGPYIYETMHMNCRVSNRKIKETFGWEPRYTGFREGIAATVKALRNSGQLP